MRRRIRDFDRECARIRDEKPRKIDEAGIFPNAVAPRLTRRSRAPDGSGGASGPDRMGVWHYGPRPHLGRVPAQLRIAEPAAGLGGRRDVVVERIVAVAESPRVSCHGAAGGGGVCHGDSLTHIRRLRKLHAWGCRRGGRWQSPAALPDRPQERREMRWAPLPAGHSRRPSVSDRSKKPDRQPRLGLVPPTLLPLVTETLGR